MCICYRIFNVLVILYCKHPIKKEKRKLPFIYRYTVFVQSCITKEFNSERVCWADIHIRFNVVNCIIVVYRRPVL